MTRFLSLLVFVLPLAAAPAGPVGDVFPRTPAYYVVRYGLPDSSAESERRAFLHPGTDGFTEVRAPFSVRRYHGRELRIEAVFFRPELVLAAVTIERPAGWTRADVDALLAEYGGRWRRPAGDIWVSEEGVRAIHRERTFYLLSPRLVGALDAERFAHR